MRKLLAQLPIGWSLDKSLNFPESYVCPVSGNVIEEASGAPLSSLHANNGSIDKLCRVLPVRGVPTKALGREVTMRLVILGFLASFALLVAGSPAAAQDAAETAIILGGTGASQGRAQKSLGSSIARSMGRAANAVASTNGHGSSPAPRRPRHAKSKTGGHFAIALPGDVDPLSATDAPTYKLENGASIRVSGGLRRNTGDFAKTVQ